MRLIIYTCIILLLITLQSCKDKTIDPIEDYTITGTVLSDGNPVEGAVINIKNLPTLSTQSDNKGNFKIKNVPKGNYELTVRKNLTDGAFTERTVSITIPNNLDIGYIILPPEIQLFWPEGNSDNSLTLKWSSSHASDFKKYEVYQDISSNVNDSTSTLLHTSTQVTDTTFVVSNLNQSTVYYFRILVFNESERLGASNSVSTNDIPFNLSGKLNPVYSNNDASKYIITITGPVTQEDTTNTTGEFAFENVIEGKYNLSVSDSLNLLGDTDITIYPDQFISLELKDFLLNYFPLKIGNRWVYTFNYRPVGSEPWVYEKGQITWTIIKNGMNDREFIIQEVAEGLKYNYDTTNFGPDTLETTFDIDEDIWVKIKLSFFRLLSDSVIVKRFYPKNSSDLLNIRNYDSRRYLTDDQIKGDFNFHDITLQRDVGIKYWHYGGGSNGAPHLTLNLIDYEIK